MRPDSPDPQARRLRGPRHPGWSSSQARCFSGRRYAASGTNFLDDASIRMPISQSVIVRTSPANRVGNCRSEDDAGPRTTLPFVPKREPWHGHS